MPVVIDMAKTPLVRRTFLHKEWVQKEYGFPTNGYHWQSRMHRLKASIYPVSYPPNPSVKRVEWETDWNYAVMYHRQDGSGELELLLNWIAEDAIDGQPTPVAAMEMCESFILDWLRENSDAQFWPG